MLPALTLVQCSKGGSAGWISIQWIKQLVFLTRIHWTVIYTVDIAIQRFNNRGLDINPNGGIVLRDTNIAFSLGVLLSQALFWQTSLGESFFLQSRQCTKGKQYKHSGNTVKPELFFSFRFKTSPARPPRCFTKVRGQVSFSDAIFLFRKPFPYYHFFL